MWGYAETLSRSLTQACHPPTKKGSCNLGRLAKGLHPRTGQPILDTTESSGDIEFDLLVPPPPTPHHEAPRSRTGRQRGRGRTSSAPPRAETVEGPREEQPGDPSELLPVGLVCPTQTREYTTGEPAQASSWSKTGTTTPEDPRPRRFGLSDPALGKGIPKGACLDTEEQFTGTPGQGSSNISQPSKAQEEEPTGPPRTLGPGGLVGPILPRVRGNGNLSKGQRGES